MGFLATHLLERVGINQNPPELNDLRRVLGHIYAMFVAGGRDVNDDVAVDVERLSGHGRRVFLVVSGGRRKTGARDAGAARRERQDGMTATRRWPDVGQDRICRQRAMYAESPLKICCN